MEYEYVALTWSTRGSEVAEEFCTDRRRLIANGWEEIAQGPFLPKRNGGACIMRRPKDEP